MLTACGRWRISSAKWLRLPWRASLSWRASRRPRRAGRQAATARLVEACWPPGASAPWAVRRSSPEQLPLDALIGEVGRAAGY